MKTYLFDLDGTIYLGDKPINGAIAKLQELRDGGDRVFFLTNNSSRNKSQYKDKLAKMGYDANLEDIISSADATVYFLKNYRKGKSVYPIGTPALENLLIENDITLDRTYNADLVLLGFDTTLTYQKLLEASILLQRNREFIVTHPDDVCPSDIGDMPDVGAFLALFKVATNRVPNIIIGKPYPMMAEFVESQTKVDKKDIIMIGDRIYTDIAFGINNGYVTYFVLSGEGTVAMLNKTDYKPNKILNSVADI